MSEIPARGKNDSEPADIKISSVPQPEEGNWFAEIYSTLRITTGIDFSLYRESTITRRILHRLTVRSIPNLREYARQLERDPGELHALQEDLLIGVTSFFRDAESFEALKRVALPRITQDRPKGSPIRVWVPGCATGEEAYSIAIAIQEHLDEDGREFPVVIFASDISESAIRKARNGRYPANIEADVSPDRLTEYFVKSHDGYQIGKRIREMCVFSRHNLIEDPPFSKLDLISCRNVLIYLGAVQKKIIPLFHFALRPNAILLLGHSETAAQGDLFTPIDREHRIYARQEISRKRHHSTAAKGPGGAPKQPAPAPRALLWDAADLRKEVDQLLLLRYSPAAVVIDHNLEVLEIRSQSSRYLKLPTGRMSSNLVKLIADPGLFLEVQKAIHQVRRSGVASRKEHMHRGEDGLASAVTVEIILLTQRNGGTLLVLFEPVKTADAGNTVAGGVDRRIARQREEQRTFRKESQSAVHFRAHTGCDAERGN